MTAAPRTPRPKPRPAGPKTDRRTAILLAAERLFGDRGYHAVSIREVAEVARVPIGLIGYYFVSKEGLLRGIFAYRQPTIEERIGGLRRVMQDVKGLHPDDALREIVRAFVEPVVRLRALPASEYFMRLVTRAVTDQNAEMQDVIRDHFDPLAQEYIAAFHQVLPEQDQATVTWAYELALGSLLVFVADPRVERLSGGKCRSADPAALPLLIDFITAGFGAACAKPVRRRKSRPGPPGHSISRPKEEKSC
jgi:AcrR family transcriptional regulator